MTDLHKAAMQQALEFVEFCWRDVAMNDYAEEQRAKVEAVLREALAAPVVPVAVRYDFDGYGWLYCDNGSGSDWLTRHKEAEPLYDHPAPVVPEWIAVSEEMPIPGKPVLACYKNHLGNTRRIRAFWTPANTTESGGDSDIGVYDEATDTYYDPAGWYECMDNWDEYSAIFVNEGEVTHWMLLPAAPKPKEQT